MGFVDVGLFSGLTVRRGGRFVCCKDGNGVEGDFGRREEGLEEERHGLKEVKRSESGSVDRPRLVLTRRVTAESFRGRGNGQRDAMISRALPLTLRRSDASSVSSSASSSFATSLQREEALYAFFVEAGGVGEMYNLPTPRRSADPPQRFLEINFGFVLPGSRQSFNCSNPRVTGTLRQWYEVAHSWGLLRHELREVLTLGEDRRKSVNRDVLQRPMNREPTKSTGRFSRLLRNSEALRPSLREPRVIAIGDVHGCIDELQNLLRLVDYRPGDQVIFLGDLVAKGPDSVSVVQLAREINARSVRGNHDHEGLSMTSTHIPHTPYTPHTTPSGKKTATDVLLSLVRTFLHRPPLPIPIWTFSAGRPTCLHAPSDEQKKLDSGEMARSSEPRRKAATCILRTLSDCTVFIGRGSGMVTCVSVVHFCPRHGLFVRPCRVHSRYETFPPKPKIDDEYAICSHGRNSHGKARPRQGMGTAMARSRDCRLWPRRIPRLAATSLCIRN